MNSAPSWVRTSSLAAALVVVMFVPSSDAKGASRARAATAGARRSAMPHAGGQRTAMRMNRGAGYRNRNLSANQNNGPVISNLHSTLSLLAQADHDYQGHRAKAMHHIGTAIRTLQPAAMRQNQPNPALAYMNASRANGNGAAAGKGANASKKKAVPQATSDQHVQRSLQALNLIGTHLSNNGTTTHHARATASIQQAIQELNVALNIK